MVLDRFGHEVSQAFHVDAGPSGSGRVGFPQGGTLGREIEDGRPKRSTGLGWKNHRNRNESSTPRRHIRVLSRGERNRRADVYMTGIFHVLGTQYVQSITPVSNAILKYWPCRGRGSHGNWQVDSPCGHPGRYAFPRGHRPVDHRPLLSPRRWPVAPRRPDLIT